VSTFTVAKRRGGGALLHWHLYFYEATELAVFMFAACAFSVLLFYARSPLVAWLPSVHLREILLAVILGTVIVGIIKSPFGKQSGAHINPAFTLTYLWLGRIDPFDATWYIVAHFIGAIVGVGFSAFLFGQALAAPGIEYAATVPGVYGRGAAFAAEVFMAVVLMSAVLWTTNRPGFAPWTAYVVGTLIAIDVFVFGPVSGAALNPARTTGSAVFAHIWTAIGLYFVAPIGGMLLAAGMYVWANRRGLSAVLCAKVDPDPRTLCPFLCHYPGHQHTWEHPTAAGNPT
jgi:aquaporin Z